VAGFNVSPHIFLANVSFESEKETLDLDFVANALMQDDFSSFFNNLASSGIIELVTLPNSIKQSLLLDIQAQPLVPSNITQENPIMRKVVQDANTDGLIIVNREYRILLTSHLLGPNFNTWSAEIESNILIYGRDGQIVLNVTWFDHSNITLKRKNISGYEAVELLQDAILRANKTTMNILVETFSGHNLPSNLDIEKAKIGEAPKSYEEELMFELKSGICFRGIVVFGIIWLTIYLVTRSEEPKKPVVILRVVSALILFALAIEVDKTL